MPRPSTRRGSRASGRSGSPRAPRPPSGWSTSSWPRCASAARPRCARSRSSTRTSTSRCPARCAATPRPPPSRDQARPACRGRACRGRAVGYATFHPTTLDGEGADMAAAEVLLMVGTTKGAFLFRGGEDRSAGFEVSGPYFPGLAVYALAFDGRGGRRRLLAGVESSHWGAMVHRSDDLGRTWSDPAEGNVRFPEGTAAALTRVWQLTPA